MWKFLFDSLAMPLSHTRFVADMSHVSLLEQSIDEDDADQSVAKQQRDNDAQAQAEIQTVSPGVAAKPRATLHTAIDVEMASGKNRFSASFVSLIFCGCLRK